VGGGAGGQMVWHKEFRPADRCGRRCRKVCVRGGGGERETLFATSNPAPLIGAAGGVDNGASGGEDAEGEGGGGIFRKGWCHSIFWRT
jgi:hypothetical protein